MANEQNLRPCEYKLTEEDVKKGQVAAVRSRRARKSMREIANVILGMSLKTGDIHDVEDIQSLAELHNKNLTVEQAIIIKQTEKALKGDLRSAEFVRDTAGQKPVEQMAVDMSKNKSEAIELLENIKALKAGAEEKNVNKT